MYQIGDYIILKKLGEGTVGKVYLANKKGRKELFAIKKLYRKEVEAPEKIKYFENEIKIMKILQHPNIVRIEEIKKDKQYYYVLMEYINGGSLSDCLKKYKIKFGKPFSEEIVQYLMKQIIEALKYIHGKQIMHRDLKLDNIMVSFDNDNDKNNLNMLKAKVKIIDFGLSIIGLMGKTILGSPLNMAPFFIERFKMSPANKICKIEEYDQKVDIWSIGTVCYEMIIGKSVFEANDLDELRRKVKEGNYILPTSLSREMVSFINAMLQYDGKKRLNAKELADHPFLKKRISDFSKIDLNRVSNKVDHKGLNINIKNNETIWSIFNKQDELTLSNIGLSESIPLGNINYQNQNFINDLRIPSNNFDKNNNPQNQPSFSYNQTNNSSASNISNNSDNFYSLSIYNKNQNVKLGNNQINNISNMGSQQLVNKNNFSTPIQNRPYIGINNNNYQNNIHNIIRGASPHNQNYSPLDNDDNFEDAGQCLIF